MQAQNQKVAEKGRSKLFSGSCSVELATRESLTFNCLLTGANDEIRTRDLLITNQLLYQLSYIGVHFCRPFVPFPDKGP